MFLRTLFNSKISILLFELIFVEVCLGENLVVDSNLGGTSEKLFYFVQVTDLHLTHFGSPDRIKQFETFCNEVLRQMIKPRVTLVSGDLINSANDYSRKAGRLFQAAQYEQEWRVYNDLLNRTKITESTLWLDMRGNHDTFMDSNPDSERSFYRIYSHQGRQHTASYQYTIRTRDNEKYSFISVDLCPRPGMGRPFNLLGLLTEAERSRLEQLSRETNDSTAIIYFGHYPIKFGYTTGLSQIMKGGLVYLNGHLHVGRKDFFTRHADQLLEIHLADWKSKRRFRLVTIDHGLLSFADHRFNQTIFAVITNPKAAKFKTLREPLHRLKRSSHIRLLIFSKSKIVRVLVKIDGNDVGLAEKSIDNENLFVLPWNTKNYDDEDLHEISVDIRDENDETLKLSHEFSLTESPLKIIYSSEVFLSLNWPIFTLLIALLFTLTYLVILVVHRIVQKRRSIRFVNRRLRILCSVDLMFYSLVVVSVYQLIGPWYFGYLSEDRFGVIFFWGSFVRDSFLPADAQLSIGFFQFYLFFIPLTLTLARSCTRRFDKLCRQTELGVQRRRRINFCSLCLDHGLFVLVMILAFGSSFGMMISYGFSWFVSPVGSFLCLFSIYLYWKSHQLNLNEFRSNSTVESSSNETNSRSQTSHPDNQQSLVLLPEKSD